jgi:hypothetical protein
LEYAVCLIHCKSAYSFLSTKLLITALNLWLPDKACTACCYQITLNGIFIIEGTATQITFDTFSGAIITASLLLEFYIGVKLNQV